MTRAESIPYDPEKFTALKKLIARGEGQYLEFKRKASHPDKIARELIAFANTDGGTLLVGVDDDKSVPGLRFPDEESLDIHKVLKDHCRPGLGFQESIIPVSENRFVLQWYVPKSDRRPHYYSDNGQRTSFVRVQDQTIKASREMCEIIRRKKNYKGGRLNYGESEQKILQYLVQNNPATLKDLSKAAGLNRFMTSRKLVRLVLAGIIRLTATEKGDFYSRIPD